MGAVHDSDMERDGMGVDPTIYVALISAATGVATTGLTVWQRKRINEMHYEVKNTHTTNLRDDIDRGFESVRSDIAGLRQDQRQERQERMDLGDRFDEHCKHHGGE